jgi:hypothetical protein
MAAEYRRVPRASFTSADLTGAKFRDCDMRQVKIVDSWLVDVNVSGLVGNFVVNDVDVTAFVEAELDRRHPERVQLREMQTADDYRAMWDTIERLRMCPSAPAPGYPEESRSIGRCLRVVMREECEHRRYAVRDLTVLEARR